MIKNKIRAAAVIAVGALSLTMAGTAAQAGGAKQDRLEKRAGTVWVDRGPVTALFGGNVHRGVISTADDVSTLGFGYLDGRLEAWSCPAGVTVPELYSHGEPEAPPTECVYRGARELSFRGATVTYGKNLSSARITGTAIARDPSGLRLTVRLPVDITLQSEGPTHQDVSVERYVEEDGTRVTHRSTITTRPATVSGRVGPIGLGDERSDITESDVSSQRDVFLRS